MASSNKRNTTDAVDEQESSSTFLSACNLEALRYAILDLELLQSDFNDFLTNTLKDTKKVEEKLSNLLSDGATELSYRELSKAIRPMQVVKENFNLHCRHTKQEIDALSSDLRNITHSLKNALRWAKKEAR